MPAKIDKVVVTNLGALGTKYGRPGVAAIKTAVGRLISADKKRGLATRLVAVDDAGAMAVLSAKAVSDPADPAQNKRAIDGIYHTLGPDYILLLGAVDVVPHVDLKNPLYSPKPDDDNDRWAYGDLPYACEAPYSQRARDFFGPTRVVGRLPDLTAGRDVQYLVRLLRTATRYTAVPPARYATYFGLSAQIWQASTKLSLTNTFGSAERLATVPPAKSKWSAATLRAPAHFINCHGAQASTQFYGQPASGADRYPVALDAMDVDGKLAAGTIASVECCYGGELYDPTLTGGRPGMCNTYLDNGAYAFFASTTIAYGPESGNDEADLICQYFLESVRAGASVGRATLEARQRFLKTASMSDPSNVKTIAQFNLYGDPSLTPASVSPHAAPRKAPRGGQALADRAARSERRVALFRHGLELATVQPTLRRTGESPRAAARAAMAALTRRFGLASGTTLSFTVRHPRAGRAMPKAMSAGALQPSHVHVVFDARRSTRAALPVPGISAVVVHEIDGEIVSAKKIVSR